MVKVLIVDDSVLMRTVIRDMLQKDPSIEIVGTAANGIEALEKIDSLKPELITLDIEMPKMNGLEVLRELKTVSWHPKTLMFSSLTSEGAEMTNEAIRLGADDFMLKPKDVPQLRLIADELVATIRHLTTDPMPSPREVAPPVLPQNGNSQRVVLIGSSAGGPPMLDQLVSKLPADLPAGVIITQHMPVGFTAPLAARFNRISKMPVKETENGDMIKDGMIFVSKAGVHTMIGTALSADGKKTGRIIHSSAPPVHAVRPAVDKTFESAAQVFGKNIVSVVLSGMGNDAGAGAYAIKQAGGTSIICDQKDCLVYGMARSAIQKNAVDKVLPLVKIPDAIERMVRHMAEN
ncbi:chemotaxis-specific protein-glutamate methyltransferase CheB [Methanoregula sp. UBA64]|jgi:two-component system, chemotaxis family, protein-glutamate methylesterase/glutaminase|uniref:chemotaxis-specific protein-glutamate methyltransferase CheB n=1 Tax=Methanoregula sp. UBA64 TaxID=1915554 RepID=UPI0025FC24D0|nr:chemotaxis-specific protein-glutamate methyltransferase CheB [Methanoregula sp. UBA64]